MLRYFKYIFFLSFFITIANADVVKDVEVTGNQRISEETIKIYGNIELNKDYSEKDLNKVLNDLYSTNFFEDIKIELSNNILKISLTEYPLINQLVFIGEPKKKYVEELKRLIRSKEKGSYIKNNLSKDVDIIKKIYASLGYNFATVETKIREIDNRNIDLVFEVERGNQTKITKINFTGDKKFVKNVLETL